MDIASTCSEGDLVTKDIAVATPIRVVEPEISLETVLLSTSLEPQHHLGIEAVDLLVL